MKTSKTETPATAAGTGESREMKQLAPAPELPAPTPELPSAVLAQIFSQRRAENVGRAASVCSSWRSAASLEGFAWTLAMTDLDPFCALGGADGAAALFRAVGGCWLRAASVLIQGMRMRDGEDTPCQCASPGCAATASALCCCEPSAGTSGVERRCSTHCSGPTHVACVKLKGGPLYNRWVFGPAPYCDDPPCHFYARDYRNKLDNAIAQSVSGATLFIGGELFAYKEGGLCIGSPLRIVGAGVDSCTGHPKTTVSQHNPLGLAARLVILENMSCYMTDKDSSCCCGNGSKSGPTPAIKVRSTSMRV
ncbi:hypothetical protein FOA52_007328 [Chlamydomonas sp. UWO 241]|nr:hypothetical protein FOA52_007328 [Chlamydomonas sp. UWO 241]